MTALIGMIMVMGALGYATWKMGEMPSSLSEVSYIIPHWLFSVGMMLVGILYMPPLMDILSPNKTWLGFLMVLGIALVASSPYYKTESVKLHYIGAGVCFAFSQIVVAVANPLLLMMWLIYPMILVKETRRLWLVAAEWIGIVELTLMILTYGR